MERSQPCACVTSANPRSNTVCGTKPPPTHHFYIYISMGCPRWCSAVEVARFLESLPPTAASMGAFHLPSACEQPNATCPTWRDTLLTSDGTIVTLRGAFSHQAVLYRVAPSSMFRLRIKASRKNPVSVAGWTRTTSAAANGSWVEVTRQAVNGEGQHGYGCWFSTWAGQLPSRAFPSLRHTST